jgi:DNA-binding NarL/FixJ family response regulator
MTAPSMTPDEIAWARDAYRDGYTQRMIANWLGLSAGTVGRYIRGDAGRVADTLSPPVRSRRLPAHPSRSLSLEQASQAQQSASEGESLSAIARRLGVDRKTVRGIIRGQLYREVSS